MYLEQKMHEYSDLFLGYLTGNRTVNGKQVRIWKKAVIVYLTVLFQTSHGDLTRII
jgi:hypothetical protein